jgi:DNA mismatch repair ATPase MutS
LRGSIRRSFAEVAKLAADARRLVPAPEMRRAAEELGFYLAYRELVDPLTASGLPLCLPDVEAASTDLEAIGVWDLPLALSLAGEGRIPVLNALELHGAERILVISGPNQGGKTTTARIFGQLHHLASIGCPVPGSRVRIMLADRVLTLFEREETAEDFDGRLGGELHRWHLLLDEMTPRTAVVINEIFGSTPLADARLLGRTLVDQLIARDVPAVLVTFLDELSRVGPATVSMVSTLDPSDPSVRTFEVVRRRADGRAHAAALAARYRLGYRQITGRLAS